MTARRLKLVPVAPASASEARRQRIKTLPKPASMLEFRCGSREIVEAKTGVLLQGGKSKGGTKVLLCAMCLARGDRVVLA